MHFHGAYVHFFRAKLTCNLSMCKCILELICICINVFAPKQDMVFKHCKIVFQASVSYYSSEHVTKVIEFRYLKEELSVTCSCIFDYDIIIAQVSLAPTHHNQHNYTKTTKDSLIITIYDVGSSIYIIFYLTTYSPTHV